MLIDIDPQTILDTLKESYYTETGAQIEIGSPEFATASAQTLAWSVFINSVNNATLNRFLDTATGEYLDAIASNYGITARPAGYQATIGVRFTWNGQGGVPNYVPANSIKIKHGDTVFYNRYPLPVLDRTTGTIYREHSLFAETVGTAANNIPASAESQLIEGGYYVASYTILTMSGGGTDGYPYTEEGDNAYREWLRREIRSFAGAGTYLAYENKALNADPRVLGAYVLRQTDTGYEKGKVQIFVYTDDPTGFVVGIVQEVCSDPAFRPIGDYVVATASPTENFNLNHIIQTTYPECFRASADTRNRRILDEYRAEVMGGINRPFVFAELCKRLCEKDADGVYAIDAKPLGITIDAYTTPVYPTAGGRLMINPLTVQWDIQYGGRV